MESWVLRVVGIFRLLLRIEVVEVAVELVEAVHGRQVFVAVAEMIFADLRGHVAVGLQELRDRRVLVLKTLSRARQADLEQPGAER
jgi:hypothetical protein